MYKNIPVNTDAMKYIFIFTRGLNRSKIKYVQETKIIRHEMINKLSFTIFIGIINLNSPTATHKMFDM